MKDLRNYIFILSFAVLQAVYIFFTNNIDYLTSSFALSISLAVILTAAIVRKNKQISDTISFYVFPLLSISALFTSSTLVDPVYIHLLGVAVILLISFYFKQVYIYHYKMKEYKLGVLENFSNYANLIIFVLFTASMYGFRTELDTPSWQIIGAVLVFSSFSIHQLFWANKIEVSKSLTTLIITALVITELAWAISTLPFDYLSASILLSVAYYSLTNLAKSSLLETLESSKIKYYLSFLSVSYILIFLSVRWL